MSECGRFNYPKSRLNLNISDTTTQISSSRVTSPLLLNSSNHPPITFREHELLEYHRRCFPSSKAPCPSLPVRLSKHRPHAASGAGSEAGGAELWMARRAKTPRSRGRSPGLGTGLEALGCAANPTPRARRSTKRSQGAPASVGSRLGAE